MKELIVGESERCLEESDVESGANGRASHEGKSHQKSREGRRPKGVKRSLSG